jgi:CRP/FNR family cyclic AMP-dependent transcriptional regulator
MPGRGAQSRAGAGGRGDDLAADYDFLNLFGGDEEIVALEPGTSLFAKGDHAMTMYVVRSGAMQVHDGETVYETVMPGGLFGEMAIVDGAPRSAGARAKVASEVIVVDQRRFLAMVEKTPYFAIRIMQVLTRRLRQTNARVGLA